MNEGIEPMDNREARGTPGSRQHPRGAARKRLSA